jgi:ribosomal protein S18 acetylase RimI-like enzyme
VSAIIAAPAPTRLREAAPTDAETIVALVHGAFAEYQNVLDPPPGGLNETAHSVRAQMAAGTRVLIAERDGAPAGCVFCTPHADEGFVYLSRLSVSPAFRRRGIGNALIAAVEDRARALGCARSRLGTRVVLTQKQAWYERLGYRVIAEKAHPGRPGPTYLVMEKTLTPGDEPERP